MTIRTLHFKVALFLLATAHESARAQAFSLSTQTTAISSGYQYAFTLNYDRVGDLQQITGPMWQWTFYLEPNSPAPTGVTSPTGWQFLYKPTTGECVWYTEGANGWGSGDYGAATLAPGGSLTGFALSTPVPPDSSMVQGYDTAMNMDAATATLPVDPLGDINGDYVFNVADVITELRIASGLSTATPDMLFRADVYPDGQIDLKDAAVLLRLYAST